MNLFQVSMDLCRRHLFLGAVLLYSAFLVGFRVWAEPLDPLDGLVRLVGVSRLQVVGTVVRFPSHRWGKTEFVMEGVAEPLTGFKGRVAVKLPMLVPTLCPGDRVRVAGWLYRTRLPSRSRQFNERDYWAAQSVFVLMRVWSPDAFEVLSPASEWSLQRLAWRFHHRFVAFWRARLPADEAALVTGMTIGARGILPPDLKRRCIRAGVYHILVISGQNVAWIVGVGLLALRVLRLPRRYVIWVAALPIVFYTIAVGADPPVLRASIMALTVLAASALRRDPPPFYPLALAALLIFLWQPHALFGASFQLSFAATASFLAILPLFPPSTERQSVVARWARRTGWACLAVHLGAGPLLIHYFGQISLVGMAANWTIFPVAGLVMTIGLIVGTWGSFWPDHVPDIVLKGVHGLVWVLVRAIEWLGERSWAAVPVPSISPGICAVYYITLFSILFVIRRRKTRGQIHSSLQARRHRL